MRKRIIALLMAAFLILGGCSKAEKQDIPELLEPANAARASYTVKKMNISNVRHYDATVVPDLKGVKAQTDALVLESYAYIGDYVEKGDALLKYDMSAVSEQMNKISKQMTYQSVQNKYQNEIL